MRRMIPSLTHLLCIEAVIRHGHVTRAAEELNLTQSTVSRQIQALEAIIGKPLFERKNRRLIPTAAAIEYGENIGKLLEGIESETLRLLTGDAEDHTLCIGVYPTFGTKWLIPRLPDFTERHADLRLDLVTAITPFNFDTSPVDVALQYGSGNWTGCIAHKLVGEETIVVASPRLTPAAMKDQTLLSLRSRPDAWADHIGGSAGIAVTGPQFETFTMMIEAVHSGMGLAVVPYIHVAEALESGSLVAPMGGAVTSRFAYYLVYASASADTPKVAAFRDWLLGTCSA